MSDSSTTSQWPVLDEYIAILDIVIDQVLVIDEYIAIRDIVTSMSDLSTTVDA